MKIGLSSETPWDLIYLYSSEHHVGLLLKTVRLLLFSIIGNQYVEQKRKNSMEKSIDRVTYQERKTRSLLERDDLTLME